MCSKMNLQSWSYTVSIVHSNSLIVILHFTSHTLKIHTASMSSNESLIVIILYVGSYIKIHSLWYYTFLRTHYRFKLRRCAVMNLQSWSDCMLVYSNSFIVILHCNEESRPDEFFARTQRNYLPHHTKALSSSILSLFRNNTYNTHKINIPKLTKVKPIYIP